MGIRRAPETGQPSACATRLGGPDGAAAAVAARAARPYIPSMCRAIRVLYHFDPPTTDDEIRAASLQYVRKISGLRQPSATDAEAFDRAVEDVAAASRRLLGALRARTALRTREGEREKARARGERGAGARPAP